MKFAWQISGPPGIFMTSIVVANRFHKYLEPHIAGRFGHIGGGGPTMGPAIVQLFFLKQIPTQNPNSKGVHFIIKIAKPPYCGPFLKIRGLPNVFIFFLTHNQH